MPDFISAIIYAFGNITAQAGWWLIPLAIAAAFFAHKNIILRVCLASLLFCLIGYAATTLYLLYISFMQGAAISSFFTTPFIGIFSFWAYPTSDITSMEFAVSAAFYLYIAALLTIGSPVRQYEWTRLRTLFTREDTLRRQPAGAAAPPAPPPATPAASPPAARTAPASPAPMVTVDEDEEEREIALASRRVEQAEQSFSEAPAASPSPAPAADEGPSWWERQRERREVERARREMEQAEREAARREASPPHPAYAGHPYPYPPPYVYVQPKRPLSEWFRTAYWGTRIVILLIVTFWLVSATGTVLGMLGAFLPAPLRELFADILNQASEVVRQAPPQ